MGALHAHVRLGLVTLWDGGAKFECALTLWCSSAAAFARAVEPHARSEIVVLGTSSPSSECSAARFVLPEPTASAVRMYHVARQR